MGAIGHEDKVISPQDHCDRCVAKAYFMVALKTGDLYFCNHHFSKYESDLVGIALDIYDESDSLLMKTGASDIR